jgi:hypothetical protein
MNDLELLQVYQFDKKVRLGELRDGGYVFGDLGEVYDCYISAGVSNEESFTRDFINKYNMNEYNCFGFDGTIQGYPYEFTNKISFIKKNIGGVNDDHCTNLSYLLHKYNNIFLKMDVEGGEYPWLLSLDEHFLKNIKQIVIEFHGITGDGWGTSYADKIKCFKKLSKTHYIIHAHGNNHSHTLNNIPDVTELTYLNKNCFSVAPNVNTSILPDPILDHPNKDYTLDINLNFYPFVSHSK